MRTAAEKANKLDPLLAEAHDALGMEYARDGQWAQAESSFRKAIELDPSDSIVYGDLMAVVLLPLGRIEEAVHEMQIAEKIDPLSRSVQSDLGFVLLAAGRYEEAVIHCQKATEDHDCLGRARLGQGRIDEAIQILSKNDNPRYLGYAYGRAGRHVRRAEKLLQPQLRQTLSHRRSIFAGLGDQDRTFEALDRVAELGAVRIGRALNSPEFATSFVAIRTRVKAHLRKKVGLPE